MLTFFACKKSDQTRISNAGFTGFAKEWYYSKFKKSAEWAASPLQGEKLPDWKKSNYKKIGDIEIIEFLLITGRKQILIPSTESLNSAEKKRVAGASLSRISFIRKANREMEVRKLIYVPTLQYLQKLQYDIGESSLLNVNNEFSGQIVIRNWKGECAIC